MTMNSIIGIYGDSNSVHRPLVQAHTLVRSMDRRTDLLLFNPTKQF